MLRITLRKNSHDVSVKSLRLVTFPSSNIHSLFFILAVANSAIAAVHKDPAPTAIHIYYDGGGQIGSYLSRYKALRMSGQRVVIDGTCASACTILLSAILRNRICVTRNAVLAFHSAWNLTLTGVQASRPRTLYLWAHSLSRRRAPMDLTARRFAPGNDLFALAGNRHSVSGLPLIVGVIRNSCSKTNHSLRRCGE